MSNQRSIKSTLSEERLNRLNELGFVWEPHNEKWEQGFSLLSAFKQRQGHCLVPTNHLENKFRLGQWVKVQRSSKSTLSEERISRLNELGFIWDSINKQWEQGFNLLSTFKQREGHCLVLQNHIENGYRLGQWVNRQRSSKSTLSEERISRLNELGFFWKLLNEKWEQGFSLLLKFKQRHGNCLVPTNHLENKFRLGQWVRVQRSSKSTLSEERISRLIELGFVWDAINEQWEQGFSLLLKFKQRECHCLVPINHIEDGNRLGKWVSVQRSSKSTLSEERISRLNELGFVWESLNEKWEQGFSLLSAFKQRQGHCLVPTNHLENKFRLGQWVNRQRSSKSTLSEDRLIRLTNLEFVWSAKKIK